MLHHRLVWCLCSVVWLHVGGTSRSSMHVTYLSYFVFRSFYVQICIKSILICISTQHTYCKCIIFNNSHKGKYTDFKEAVERCCLWKRLTIFNLHHHLCLKFTDTITEATIKAWYSQRQRKM